MVQASFAAWANRSDLPVNYRTSRQAVSASLLMLCCSADAAGVAARAELVLVAPSNHPMPMAEFAGGQLRAGILKDVGDLLAARLGRNVRFVVVPGRRVSLTLAQGKADGVCMVKPGWIEGDFHWSRAFIPTGGTVLARTDAPFVSRLTDLRGKPVGTVAGYRYTMMEAALGRDFVRDDAPSSEHNLLKLLAGRTQYAVMELSSAAYQVKHDATRTLRQDLTYEHGLAHCAFSKASSIPFADIRQAIDTMIAGRSVDRIMDRYR